MRYLKQVSCVLFFLIAIFSALPAQATWQRVAVLNFGRPSIRSGYFFNEQVGFIGIIDARGGLKKTTNGGKSWIDCTVPGSTSANINQIYFVTTQIGYAALGGTVGRDARGLKTTDGGNTWTYINSIGASSDVTSVGNDIFFTSSPDYGAISYDNGATYTTNVLQYTNGIAFVDAQHGVASSFQNSKWWVTSNGGTQWTQISQTIEAWGIYGDKISKAFYVAPEEDPRFARTGGSPVLKSVDFGQSWQKTTTLPYRTTGHIAGFQNVLYVQADTDRAFNPANAGLLRSTDGGVTWVKVGGPSGCRDSRFAVTGCRGGVVYAFSPDDGGTVWKTTDGGDGGIQEPPVYPIIQPTSISLQSQICENSLSSITLKNLYCEDVQIVHVGFVDSSGREVKSGGLTFGYVPASPAILTTNQQDSVQLEWIPSKFTHRDTTITTRIRITYFSTTLGQNVDTIITITAQAKGEAPQAQLSSQSIKLDTFYTCVPRDTAFYLINKGCDTLFINSYTAAQRAGITLEDTSGKVLNFPIAIPPGDTSRLLAHILSLQGDAYSFNLMLKLEHQGLGQDLPVALNGFSSIGKAWNADSLIAFGSVNICRVIDSSAILKNLTCDSLSITNISFKHGTNYIKLIPNATKALQPGDSLRIPFRFTPSGTGALPDSLYLDINVLGVNRRVVIAISGAATQDASRLLSTLDSDLTFKTYTRCDPPDSIIFFLKNPGCTNIQVQSVRLSAALAPVVNRKVNGLPFNMTDGDSLRIVVTVNPSTLGLYSGNVRISYSLGGVAQPDTFIAVNVNVIHGSRILSVNNADRVLDTIEFCGTHDTSIIYKNLGCDSMYISTRSLASSGFVLLNAKPTPLGLAAGQSDTIKLRFIPVQAGPATGTVAISSDADSAASQTIQLFAYARATDTVKLLVRPPDTITHVGSVMSLSVIPEQTTNKPGLRSLDFLLSYNGDILTPLDAFTLLPLAKVTLGSEQHQADRRTFLPVNITSAVDIIMDTIRPLATVCFRTTISDSTHTNLRLESLSANNNDKNYAKCVLGIISEFTDFQVALLCGDSTLENFMRFGKNMPFIVAPAIPNPVITASSSELHIPYTLTEDGSMQITVYDEHGVEVQQQLFPVAAKGDGAFTINVKSLPAGTFHYMVSYNGAAASYSTAGKFVVVK